MAAESLTLHCLVLNAEKKANGSLDAPLSPQCSGPVICLVSLCLERADLDADFGGETA